jgi:D-arabinose 1-dehydrogenase-like Zn-dependent alcohol dehydrogenase
MPKMRAAAVSKPSQPFQMLEREVPKPGAGQVLVRVQACGVCHSDMLTREAAWPGLELPRVPGHEIAGVIEQLGADVGGGWATGDRVGIGWYGGHDRVCEPCRRGDFILCRRLKVPGLSYDGGYADFVLAPAETLARIPESLSPTEAAPLLCAGVTTFNALRHSGAMSGDLVVVLGIGGLGHLGVQFASKMGFETVAVARGRDKEPLARKLGAHHYVDNQSGRLGEQLQALGGARVILSTVTSSDAMTASIAGLAPGGKLIVLGVGSDPIQVSPTAIVLNRISVDGWPCGTSIDSQDTLKFAAQSGVRPMIETFPLARAEEAYARMMSGAARFRAVLTM